MSLGDNLQLQIVIRHLQQQRGYFVGVEALPGSHSVFHGVADAVHVMRHPITWREDYDDIKTMHFERPEFSWQNTPSTKPRMCFDQYFQYVIPDEKLFYYELHINDHARAKADRYIREELPDWPYVVVHYTGTSTRNHKDLTDFQAEMLCRSLVESGYTVLVLDWHRRTTLDQNEHVICPHNGHWLWHDDEGRPFKNGGDAAVIGALMQRSAGVFGIDSGIEHLAGALDIPTCVFWTGYHPVYCYDLADNVIHFVDSAIGHAVPDAARSYFESRYHHVYYDDLDSLLAWLGEAEEITPGV